MQKIDIKKESFELASRLHNKWRISRKIVTGLAVDGLAKREEKFVPINPLNPSGPKIDIANTPFDKLPIAWQNENYLSAKEAIEDISYYDETVDLEEASSKTHDAWKKRHLLASENQAAPYSNLSNSEKDKDRAVVKEVVEEVNRDGYDIKLS